MLDSGVPFIFHGTDTTDFNFNRYRIQYTLWWENEYRINPQLRQRRPTEDVIIARTPMEAIELGQHFLISTLHDLSLNEVWKPEDFIANIFYCASTGNWVIEVLHIDPSDAIIIWGFIPSEVISINYVTGIVTSHHKNRGSVNINEERWSRSFSYEDFFEYTAEFLVYWIIAHRPVTPEEFSESYLERFLELAPIWASSMFPDIPFGEFVQHFPEWLLEVLPENFFEELGLDIK